MCKSDAPCDVDFLENKNLVIQVQKRLSLYMMKEPMYHNNNCQDLLWKQVGDSLGTSFFGDSKKCNEYFVSKKMHRCVAWFMCERKRNFLWVFIMLHAILWRPEVRRGVVYV